MDASVTIPECHRPHHLPRDDIDDDASGTGTRKLNPPSATHWATSTRDPRNRHNQHRLRRQITLPQVRLSPDCPARPPKGNPRLTSKVTCVPHRLFSLKATLHCSAETASKFKVALSCEAVLQKAFVNVHRPACTAVQVFYMITLWRACCHSLVHSLSVTPSTSLP